MRFRLIATVAALCMVPGMALADEAADCQAGIDMIKAEIAKGPDAEKLAQLEKFLKDAEREMGEKEYDECLEAAEDAKEVVAG